MYRHFYGFGVSFLYVDRLLLYFIEKFLFCSEFVNI